MTDQFHSTYCATRHGLNQCTCGYSKLPSKLELTISRLHAQLDKSISELYDLGKLNASLQIKLDEANNLIKTAIVIMTFDQLGQWHGIRAWLESNKEKK